MKQWRRRKYGMKLELAGVSWLKDYGFDNILWDTIGPVDVKVFGWGNVPLLMEFEMKRLNRTRYVTRSWLQREVVDKFSPDAWLKILVVTKVCWHPRDDAFLDENRIKVIAVGPIDREKEIRRAKERFMNAFTQIWVNEFLKEEVVVCQRKSSASL